MTNVHLAFSDSDRVASRPTANGASDVSSQAAPATPPGSFQDMQYTVAGRRAQAQVIGGFVRSGMRRLKRGFRSAWNWYRQRRTERRTLEALRALDDHLLRDIGLSRYQLAAQVHARLSSTGKPASVVAIDSRRSNQAAIRHTERAA